MKCTLLRFFYIYVFLVISIFCLFFFCLTSSNRPRALAVRLSGYVDLYFVSDFFVEFVPCPVFIAFFVLYTVFSFVFLLFEGHSSFVAFVGLLSSFIDQLVTWGPCLVPSDKQLLVTSRLFYLQCMYLSPKCISIITVFPPAFISIPFIFYFYPSPLPPTISPHCEVEELLCLMTSRGARMPQSPVWFGDGRDDLVCCCHIAFHVGFPSAWVVFCIRLKTSDSISHIHFFF